MAAVSLFSTARLTSCETLRFITRESLGTKRKSREKSYLSFGAISSNQFTMAEFNNTEGTRELGTLLEGLNITKETSHHSGQSVYTNQLTAFLHGTDSCTESKMYKALYVSGRFHTNRIRFHTNLLVDSIQTEVDTTQLPFTTFKLMETVLHRSLYLSYPNVLEFVNTAALTKLRTKIISYFEFIVIVIKLLDNK